MRDNRLALQMLDVLSPSSDTMRFATIPGAPSNHSTNRSDGRRIMSGLFTEPLTGNLAIGCVFFRPNRQRLDVDNMMKHICDMATGVAWLDDSQVTALMGRVELDAGNPRTVVMIARHKSSLVRSRGTERTCEHCGAPFTINTSKPQRICSQACRSEWQIAHNHERRRRQHLPCSQCGATTSKPGVMLCRRCWMVRNTPEAMVHGGV